jgi:hypothetical protein
LALILAGFTHLWNPIGFPVPNEDESIYLGRAVNFLNTLEVRDNSIGYDHPYFGQIFLAAFLGITGYQDFFSSPGHLNYEMIFLIPRIFMGILAIADTFLIFKIAELLYNRKVGFVAAILFAVTPTTWLTRWILLDSIQLPLILLSILFAVFSFRGTREGSKNNSKNILLVLLSGTFLGLSIFTKIPAIMIVPLVGYLIFTNSKWNFKILGLWFIPVILIPLLWPAYSISVGEFNSWLNGIIKQAHRAPNPLYFSITEFLMRDPLLLIVGSIGIILAVVKKDLFILLAVIPFLIFMYFVNYVVLHHLMWVVVILCISASRLFVDILTFVKRYKPLLLLSLGGISLFFVFAFTSTIELVTRNETSQFFGAAALVDQYLEAKLITNNNNNSPDSNKNIKVLGNTFFIWIQQYVFHNDNYVSFFQIPKKLEFENQNVISIIDSRFKRELQRDDYTGITLRKMFSTFDTKSIATFNPTLYGDKIDILLTNLERPNKTAIEVTNILDKANHWKKSKYMDIQRGLGTLNMTVDTKNATKDSNVNTAFLKTPLNLTKGPTLLSIGYLTKSDDTNTEFIIEIRDKNNTELWTRLLKHTNGIFQPQLLSLGTDISDEQIKLDVKIRTNEKGLHTISFNKFSLIS